MPPKMCYSIVTIHVSLKKNLGQFELEDRHRLGGLHDNVGGTAPYLKKSTSTTNCNKEKKSLLYCFCTLSVILL